MTGDMEEDICRAWEKRGAEENEERECGSEARRMQRDDVGAASFDEEEDRWRPKEDGIRLTIEPFNTTSLPTNAESLC